MTDVEQRALGARRSSATLRDVMRVARRAFAVGVRTLIPARVVTYDPATQKANVSLEHITVHYSEAGEQEDLPIVLQSCPVQWMSTLAGRVTLPLVPGDTGALIISDRSLNKWLQFGLPTDPQFRHMHNPIDGVFYPGLHPDTVPLVPPTSLLAAVIDGPLVDLGVGATDFLIKGTALSAALTPIITTLTAVPPAGDLTTVITLANANQVAILAALAAIQAAVSVKTRTV